MNAIPPSDSNEPTRYRTIWISDIHLGTRGCKADFLLDFLKHNESDTLYLVGDIIDVWRMRRSWYWVQPHNDVVQKLLRKARKGTRVVFIPGNHDEIFRVITDQKIGALDEDLGTAVRRALNGDPEACRTHALAYSWEAAARQFLVNLAPMTERATP